MGIRVEEHRPPRTDERIALSDGTQGTVWSESLRAEGAETVAAYAHGMLSDSPALTPAPLQPGQGWYVSTRLDEADYGALVGRLLKMPVSNGTYPACPPVSKP